MSDPICSNPRASAVNRGLKTLNGDRARDKAKLSDQLIFEPVQAV